MFTAAEIKDIILGEGFDTCGITRVRPWSDHRAFYDSWLRRGLGGHLEYMRRNTDKRFDPALLMPGAKSIVVCGVSYKNDTSMGYGESLSPKIASYARAADYHDSIKSMLKAAAAKLEERHGAFRWRAFTDSAPVLEKRAAVEAGIGWIGRNTLLVSPRHGSFLLLGELFMDRAVDTYDTTYAGAGCGGCTRCVDACPNGALTPEGLDTRRCIACITIEKGSRSGSGDTSGSAPYDATDATPDIASGDIPRPADTHGWIFGCDECQSVCPYNISAPFHSDPRFSPLFDPREITSEDWLAMSPEQFERDFAATPLARAGLGRLKCCLDFATSKTGKPETRPGKMCEPGK